MKIRYFVYGLLLLLLSYTIYLAFQVDSFLGLMILFIFGVIGLIIGLICGISFIEKPIYDFVIWVTENW